MADNTPNPITGKPRPAKAPLASWDNYDTFKTKLRSGLQSAGVDLSGYPDDEALVSEFYKNLPAEKQQKFDFRYSMDRVAGERVNPDLSDEEATAIMQEPGKKIRVDEKGNPLDTSPTAFIKAGAKAAITPLSDFATKAGQTIADTTGLSKLPRGIRDPAATALSGLPGGQALRPIIAPEALGEEMTANMSPLAIAGNLTSAGRLAAPASRAIAGADRGLAALGTAEGLVSAGTASDNTGRFAGLQRAAFNAPGLAARAEAPAPPRLGPNFDGTDYFGGPRLQLDEMDPSAYFGGRNLEATPPPLPPPGPGPLHGPEAQLPLPGMQPRYQTTGGPEMPPPMPPPQLQGQGNLFPREDFPRPIGPRPQEPAYGELLGPPPPTGQMPLFDEMQIPPQQFGGDIPTPHQPPPLPYSEQPALFNNAGFPNFGGRNWKFSDTGEKVHQPFGPQPPKPQAPGAGATRNRLLLGNQRGQSDIPIQMIADFAGGAVGGAIGGAVGAEEDHPIMGALLGMAAGMGTTSALGRRLGPRAKTAQAAVLGAMSQEKKIEAINRANVLAESDPLKKAEIIQTYIAGLPEDPKIRMAAYSRLNSPSGAMDYWRVANGIRKGNMLSAASSLVNQTFNFPNLAARMFVMDPLRPIAGKILGNKADSGLSFLNTSGKNLPEISPYYAATYEGTVRGLKDAYRVLTQGFSDETAEASLGKTPFQEKGRSSMDFPHVEVNKMDANLGVKMLALPSDFTHRVVNALDVFPRAIARAQSQAMAGVTQALAEGSAKGLKGKALNGYVAKNYGKGVLAPEAKAEAGRRALETVLQEDPDVVTDMIIKMKMNKVVGPAVDTIIPFVKSLGNAFRQSMEVVPGVGAGIHWAHHTKMGTGLPLTPALKNEMLAKQGFGLIAMGALAAADASGRITITGPEPEGMGARIKQKAYQNPYSIMFNDEKGEPLASFEYLKIPLMAGLITNYMTARDAVRANGEGAETTQIMVDASMNIMDMLKDMSQIRLLKDGMDQITGFSDAPSRGARTKAFANLVARQLTTAIPASGAMRSYHEKFADGHIRRQEDPAQVGFDGVMKSQLPWNFKTREEVLGWDGQPIVRPGGPVARTLDPLNTMIPKGGIQRRIQKSVGSDAIPGALDTQDKFTIGEGKNKREVAVSKDEDFKRRKEVGAKRSEYITKLFKTDEFKGASKAERKLLIRKEVTKASKDVNDAFKKKLKNVDKR